MNIQGPLRKIISDNALSGSLLDDRIYPVVAPQKSSYPLAVVRVTGNTPSNMKTHTSTVDTVQAEVITFADTFEECANADEAIREAIDFYRGDVLFKSVTTSIDGIRYENTVQGIEPDTMLYMSVSTYTIRLKRDGALLIEYVPIRYFASDDEAKAAGLLPGDIYRLSNDNFYGMKYGTLVTVQ